MNSNVTGKVRAEFTDGEVNEKEINGRAVFLVQIAANKEDMQEGQEVMDVALIGATNVSEFLDKIPGAIVETLEHIAKDKVPAGVLYYKLMDRLANYISEKADDADMSLMHILMGGEREQES